MFSFLKEKIKGVLSKFSKKVEEEVVEKPEEKKEEAVEKVSEEKIVEKEILQKEEKKKKEGGKNGKRKKEAVKKEKARPKDIEKKVVETPEISKEKKDVFLEKPVSEAEKVTAKVEAEPQPVVEEEIPEIIEWPEEKKSDLKKQEEDRFVEEKPEEIMESLPPEKKGIFAKITEALTTRRISEKKFLELFWDMELLLLENNVAVEVIDKIKSDLKTNVVDKPLKRSDVEGQIADILENSISEILTFEKLDVVSDIKKKKQKPYVICFFGVNGSGKTTTIAKLASLLQKKGLQVVLGAGDTFRAAAIDQLSVHADALGVKIIKYDYGADAAAVAFDAVKFAESKNKDVVLIDTAGRQHSNVNLMDEMKKIIRVAKPDLKIFIGESITGNDCVEQARKFNEVVGIDGIILSKVDIDEKGGAALSVSYVTKKPILFLGTGQAYDDLKEFDKDFVVKNLGLI